MDMPVTSHPVGVHVLGDGRCLDPACNPYLAFAMMLNSDYRIAITDWEIKRYLSNY